MPAPAALLLDLDGVLVDSGPAHTAAWVALLAPFGIAIDRARYRAEIAGRTRADVIRGYLGDRPDHDDLMARKADLVRAWLAEHGCPEIPGAAALLRGARRRRLPLAVATASRMPEPFLQAAGLADLVSVVVSRRDVPRGKPHPDAYLEAARRLGVDPSACWVVEDSPTGLAAGRAAGCRTIGITTAHPAEDLDADHVIDRLEQVWDLLPGGPPRTSVVP